MRNNFFVCTRKQGNANNHHAAERNVFRSRTKIRFQLAPRLALCRSQSVHRVARNKDISIFVIHNISPLGSTSHKNLSPVHNDSFALIFTRFIPTPCKCCDYLTLVIYAKQPSGQKLSTHTLDTVIMSHRQQWAALREPKIVFHMTLSN